MEIHPQTRPADSPGGSLGDSERSRRLFVVAIVALVVVVVLGWLLLSGRVFLWTVNIELGPPGVSSDSGTILYRACFDGGVVNDFSKSEAAQGTAQFTMLINDYPAHTAKQVQVSLWTAMETRLRNLRVTLDAPPEWGALLFELPSADAGESLHHHTGQQGTTLIFRRLGPEGDGYRGSIFLTCYPEASLYYSSQDWSDPGQVLRVEFDFDMHGTGLRRLVRWHVHGAWEVPMTADDRRPSTL